MPINWPGKKRNPTFVLLKPRYFLLFILFLITYSGRSQYLQLAKYAWEFFDTTSAEIASNYVNEICKDKEGNLWLSTSESPQYRIVAGGRWETYESSPFGKAWQNDWLEYSPGRFWIAGPFGYILHFIPSQQLWDTIALPNESTRIIRMNSRGVLLVGCGGEYTKYNLYYIKDKKPVSLLDEMEEVHDIELEANGDALVSFKQGLYRYKMKSDGTYDNKPKKLTNNGFYDIAIDGNRKIWGTCINDGFLHSYEKGEWFVYKSGPRKLYTLRNGKETYVAGSLMILPDGRVLITTLYNTGFAVLDGDFWRDYKPELKTPGDYLSQPTLGHDGTLWFATTMNGLVAYRPAQLIKPRPPRRRRTPEMAPEPDTVTRVFTGLAEEGKKIYYIPDTNRTVKTLRTLLVQDDSVMIRIWDSQKIDGDTVSIYFNGKTLLKYKPLSATQDTFFMALNEGDNEILLYAHNLGSIPPNTATLVISVGNKVLGMDLNSDLNICERLIIRKRKR